MKRLNVVIERELYTEFRKIYPYRGELTAFIKRCMQFAIVHNRPPQEEQPKILEEVKREVYGTHNS